MTHRLAWDAVPAGVRDVVAREVAGEVAAVEPVEGGFSPCFAGALTLTGGRRVFVKAVSGAQNPDSPDLVRREIEIVRALASDAPAPALLGCFDDGEWVVIVLEHIEGSLPETPWRPEELRAALDALAEVNAALAPTGLPTASERLAPVLDGWRQLHAADAVPPPWRSRADELVELEVEALGLMQGDRLVHCDVRADNVLIRRDGRAVLVDWAHACRGAPWVDLAFWLPPLELEGGGAPDEVLAIAPAVIRPPRHALIAATAAFAGYLVYRGGLPDPPGLPTLRPFQRAQAEVALRHLGALLAG